MAAQGHIERELKTPVADDYETSFQKSKKFRKILSFVIVAATVIVLLIVLVVTLRSADDKDDEILISNPNQVTLSIGILEGTQGSFTTANDGNNVTVHSFKGIPYALPPVGKLRFQNPIPLNKSTAWSGVFNATSFGKRCVQLNTFTGKPTGSENCLFLNVFTPTLNKNANLSVFVWVHGGFLFHGSANTVGYHPDEEFSASMNIVSVTMNYRVNAFGFLTLKELWEKNTSYANYGIQDQILALRWVKEHIQHFGGNPNRVTLAGESSGGASVYAIVCAPLADGLFHRAVIMSSPALFKIPYKQLAVEHREILKFTRCKFVPAKDIKGCLLNLTAAELLNAVLQFQNPSKLASIAFDLPTKGVFTSSLVAIDPVVFVNSPENVKNINYPTNTKIPVLIGSLAQEIGLLPEKIYYDQPFTNFENDTKPKLNKFNVTYYNKIVNELYGNLTLSNKTRNASTQYIYETIASDVRVTCRNSKVAMEMNLGGKHHVYHYVITNRPSNPIIFSKYIVRNAVHQWDTIALFDFKDPLINGYQATERDRIYQKTLRNNLKSFIENGTLTNPNWKSGKTGIFNNKGSVDLLEGGYEKERCEFWNNPQNGFTDYAWTN